MYTFIHHEGSTVYIQSKTDGKLLLQTDKTHTHTKYNSPTFPQAIGYQILQIQKQQLN